MANVIEKMGAGLFVLLFSFGAVAGADPLVRVACALSLLVFGSVRALWPRLSERSQSRLALANLLVMALSFAFVASIASWLGGSAINGRATAGGYFLRQPSVMTPVSKRVYYGVAAVETLMLVSWPLGFLIGPKEESVRDRAAGGRTTR